ncbi:MAG: hypothetical protein KJ548_12375, partial [Actinobacteria bacterium]|nr:hypothetical protein [Actinomycetota bacterium]
MTGTPQHETPQDESPQEEVLPGGTPSVARDATVADVAVPTPAQPTSAQPTSAQPTQAQPTPAQPTSAQPTPAPASRRTRAQLALLVAGALVVGAGLGVVGGATARTSAADEPAVTGDGAEDLSLVVPGTSSADAKLSTLWGFGSERRTFTGEGLSQEAGLAHVWAFDAASAIDLAAVTKAAQALGVEGEPTAQWGSWVVGSSDGAGPSLSVGGDGQANLSYSDPSTWCTSGGDATVMPVEPATGTVEGSSSGSGDGTSADGTDGTDGTDATDGGDGTDGTDGSVGESPCPATGLSSDDAIARAHDLLTAVGVQLGDAELTATGSDGSMWVQADQVVEGRTTGVSWSVSYVGETVQSVWGPLAPLVDLGEYALVSPADAVARLADPRFTSSGLMMPLAAKADGVTADGVTADGSTSDVESSDQDAASPDSTSPDSTSSDSTSSDPVSPEETTEPTAAPVPTAGAPLDWGVQQVVLVSSELTLSTATLGDG